MSARIAIVCAVLFVLAPAPGFAQDDAELERAADLFQQGIELTDVERWGEAVEYFRRSLEIIERPSTLFNLGIALHRLGRATESTRTLERFRELAAGDEALRARVQEAERLLVTIRATIGELRLAVDPPDAIVRIDGSVAPGDGALRTIAIDPGSHRVLVEASGHRTAESEVSVLPGATLEEEVRLEPLPVTAELEPPPADAPTPSDGASDDGWLWGLGIGLAAAAVVAIVVTAVVLAPSNDPLSEYGGSTGRTYEPLLRF
jgi:hypothetical protein